MASEWAKQKAQHIFTEAHESKWHRSNASFRALVEDWLDIAREDGMANPDEWEILYGQWQTFQEIAHRNAQERDAWKAKAEELQHK